MNRKDNSDLGGTLSRLAELSTKLGDARATMNFTRRLLRLQRKQADSPQATMLDLNNYAWSLLTVHPESLRVPQSALVYAQKAVKMSDGEVPNLLDTLALAYFLTGDRQRAIATEQKAISLLPQDSPLRPDLEANLKRFRATGANSIP